MKLWKYRVHINENYFKDKDMTSDDIVSDVLQNNTKAFVDSFDIKMTIHNRLTVTNYNVRKRVKLIEYIISQSVVFEDVIVDKVTIMNTKDPNKASVTIKRDDIPDKDDFIENIRKQIQKESYFIFPDIEMIITVNYKLDKKVSFNIFCKSFLKMLSLLSEKVMYSSEDSGEIIFDEKLQIKIDLFENPFDSQIKDIYTYLFQNNVDFSKNYFVIDYSKSININRIMSNACSKIYDEYAIKCYLMEPIIYKRDNVYIMRIMIENFPDDKKILELDDILPILVHYLIDSIPYMFIQNKRFAVSFHIADNLKISDIDKMKYNHHNNNRDNKMYSQLKTDIIKPTDYLKNNNKTRCCRFMYKSYGYNNRHNSVGVYILFPRKNDYLFANPQNYESTDTYMNFQNYFLQKPV